MPRVELQCVWVTKQMTYEHLWVGICSCCFFFSWAETVLSRELWLLIEKKKKYWSVLQAIKQAEQRKPFAGVARFAVSLSARRNSLHRLELIPAELFLLHSPTLSLEVLFH